MTEMGTIVPPNKPFTFEGLDIRPSFRAAESGTHTYSVNIMVTEQMWNELKTIPRHKMIGGILYWYHDEADLPKDVVESLSPKARPEKGPYSQYWQWLFKQGVQNFPDILEALGVQEPKEVKDALHEAFGVESLTFVGPGAFEKWATERNLQSLVTLSRQAEIKAVS